MKWRIDQIQRYVKISSEPFIVSLHFDVPRRSDRTRKYKMEYADAQVIFYFIHCELNWENMFLNLYWFEYFLNYFQFV